MRLMIVAFVLICCLGCKREELSWEKNRDGSSTLGAKGSNGKLVPAMDPFDSKDSPPGDHRGNK